MMSGAAIAALSREQAVRAAAYELEPYAPADRDEPFQWKTFPFPNIGDYRPAGWCLVEYVTADKTGWDRSGPALSADELRQWVSDRVDGSSNNGCQAGFALIEEGQFQIVVGFFSDDPDLVEACTDNREEYDITWCDDCGAPFENDEDDTACPSCGYDPNECPECGCNPCECPPFDVDDKVWFINPNGTRVEGRIAQVVADYEEVTIETPEGLIFEEIDWSEVSFQYDPATDPNQIALPLGE